MHAAIEKVCIKNMIDNKETSEWKGNAMVYSTNKETSDGIWSSKWYAERTYSDVLIMVEKWNMLTGDM